MEPGWWSAWPWQVLTVCALGISGLGVSDSFSAEQVDVGLVLGALPAPAEGGAPDLWGLVPALSRDPGLDFLIRAGLGWQAWGWGWERLGRAHCFRSSDLPS